MTEIYIFIITACFIAGQSLVETRQDYWVIQWQKIFPASKIVWRWKFWGNTYELAYLTFYCITVAYFLGSWPVLLWIPILWILRTILHNGFIAVMLGEKFYYLGDTGFDGKIKKMFLGSGLFFLIIEIFILIVVIFSYLSVKFNWDLWQMILNIFR